MSGHAYLPEYIYSDAHPPMNNWGMLQPPKRLELLETPLIELAGLGIGQQAALRTCLSLRYRLHFHVKSRIALH